MSATFSLFALLWILWDWGYRKVKRRREGR
jgi:hypothetical protein